MKADEGGDLKKSHVISGLACGVIVRGRGFGAWGVRFWGCGFWPCLHWSLFYFIFYRLWGSMLKALVWDGGLWTQLVQDSEWFFSGLYEGVQLIR